MKRLLIVLALLLGAPAYAADDPVIFRAVSSIRITGLTNVYPATSTAAISAFVRYVRAVCTVNCFFATTATPLVEANTRPIWLPGGIPEYFVVTPGQYVFVRSDSSSGTLYVTEMDR